MTSPIPGALVLTGWVAPAPTGHDEAFLLLTTGDPDSGGSMPAIAEALGVVGPPGSPASPDVWACERDGWISLQAPGGPDELRGAAEWFDIADRQRRVVLVVGMVPMPPEMGSSTYTDRHGADARIALIPWRGNGQEE